MGCAGTRVITLLELLDETLDELCEELLNTTEDEEDCLLESEEKLLVVTVRLLADLAELLIWDDRVLLTASELATIAELRDELRLVVELLVKLLTAEELLETAGLLLEDGVGFGTRLFATELVLVTGVEPPPPPPPPQALKNADITKALRIPRD